MRLRLGWTALVVILLPATAARAGEPVAIELPVKARLDLSDYRSLAVVPFVTATAEGSEPAAGLEGQLTSYLRRVVERASSLTVHTLAVDLPNYDPEALAANEVFWRHLGERSGADLILAGALDLDVQDRSGYVTREFVSDQDGRTYFSQALVEATGVELDLLLWVIDGRSGRILLEDHFKEFKAWDGERRDPTRDLFSDLGTLEDRLAGIFRHRTVTAERLLQ